MSDSSTLSLRVETEIIDALDAAAEESVASRSKVARAALLEGIEQLTDGDGDVSVPEYVAHDAKIKRLINRNKRVRRSGKFRSEFSKQLKRSFKNNEHPEEFERSVAGYLEEAEDMGELPEAVQEETGCRTFREWTQDKLDYYRAAYQASTFDADPIENPLRDFEGIGGAREWLNRAEKIASEAAKAPGDRTTEKARDMARYALQDGVVPEAIQEEANDSSAPSKAVASAAVDLAESSARLNAEDSDTPELN